MKKFLVVICLCVLILVACKSNTVTSSSAPNNCIPVSYLLCRVIDTEMNAVCYVYAGSGVSCILLGDE